jgi:hypothetical protein
MKGLMLHCGGEPATLAEIGKVKMPKVGTRPSTDKALLAKDPKAEIITYQPVNHRELIEKVIEITTDCLPVTPAGQAFGLRSKGDHMFGLLTFDHKSGCKDMGLQIGVANSYDKTIAAKIAAGASVFVCDNMCFSGEVTYARKHTKFVWDDIEETIESHILKSMAAFEDVVKQAELLKAVGLTNDQAFSALGVLHGRGIINGQQTNQAIKDWKKPRFKDFHPRNVWSLYNTANETLKRSRPDIVMEKHIELHNFLCKEQEIFVN